MAKKKTNCWEHKKCGREPGGAKVKELGACAVTAEIRLNGIHGGLNAGRACWVVAGTFCGGKVQGVFAKKYSTCKECDFYKKVQDEDYDCFEVTLSLMKRLKNGV